MLRKLSYYIIVEGKKSEKKIYPKWLNLLNPNLKEIFNIENFDQNNFLIVSGYGYPYYLDIINDSIDDMKNYSNIDRLVIIVDSEDFTYEEKYNEISNFINSKIDMKKVIIIIQYYCIETWALGNKLIIKRNPEDAELKKYIRFYNVIYNDPEKMESIDRSIMNRAQFTHDYLKRTLKDKYRGLSYTKRNPEIICHQKYFEQIVKRYESTNHIQSFSSFYDTFRINQ